ncbi:MAG: hypothetical protein Fur0037_28150 [Planctomycetota bacterium]
MTTITAHLVTDPPPVLLHVQAEGRAAVAYAIEICRNPVCHCRSLSLIADRASAEAAGLPARLDVDPFDRDAGAEDDSVPPYVRAIADAISPRDWQKLAAIFRAGKERVFATLDPTRVQAYFPVEEIEREGSMVALHEIIPFAKDLGAPGNDGRRIVLDENYCVRPSCRCTEAVLVPILVADLYDPREPEPLAPMAVDWRNGRWTTPDGRKDLGAREWALVQRLLAANPDLLEQLGRRHRLLRRMYETVRPRLIRESRPCQSRASPKVGRNDPCPRGSGRKHKKCCLHGEAPAGQ